MLTSCKRRLVGVLVAALAVGSSCHGREESAIGTPAAPVIFVLPNTHVERESADVAQLSAALSQETSLAVQVRIARSSVEAIQVFGTRRADVGLLPLFEYLLAHQEYAARARLQVLREEGKASYRGQLVVSADSPIRTVADLQGKKLAYADPYSMSGFVLPAKMLADAGVRPVPVFAGAHVNALAELRAGRVDAAATFVDSERLAPDLRVVVTTTEIPNEPVFFRADLDERIQQKIITGLERLAATPEGLAALHDIGGIHSFMRVDDSAYAAIPEVIRAAGTAIESLVPGGWIVWQSNRSDVAP